MFSARLVLKRKHQKQSRVDGAIGAAEASVPMGHSPHTRSPLAIRSAKKPSGLGRMVINSRHDDELSKIRGALDMILVTVNVPLNWAGLL